MFPCTIYRINLDFLIEKSSYEIKFNQLCENSSRTIKRELNYENLNSQFIFTQKLHEQNSSSTLSSTYVNAENTLSNLVSGGNLDSTRSDFFNEFNNASTIGGLDMVSNKNNDIYQKIISSNKVNFYLQT
jgi:hypothetical protein